MMKKVVIGLSGGMDSATLLGMLLEQGAEVHCCTFYYGSKHNKWENRAAENIIDFYQGLNYPIIGHVINLEEAFGEFNSNLLLSGSAIPEGNYNDENMKKTVVPNRNMILISVMVGLAESIGAETVALGVHSGDHHIYPDCRQEFIFALNAAVYLATDRKVKIETPLIYLDKTSILRKGYNLHTQVPYQLTRTCYKDQPVSCGKCGSCRERLEAFDNIKLKDPIKYE